MRLLTQDLDFIENRMAGIVASAGAKQIQSGLLSPLQLPGLQLWLDGADPLGSGIAPANTTLSTWIDKSGNGRNASGFGSPPYVSANRSVSLNGSQYYTIPYAGTHSTESIFFVLTCTNVSSAQILLVGNVTGTRQIVQVAPQIGVTGVSNNASCGNPSLNTLSMLEFTFNSSDTFAYLNGTPGSRGDGMNPGYESFVYLGCSLSVGTFFTGTISEILIYNQFLSTYQRQAIEGYLAWKWNIISSLPANHPYRNSAASPSVISTNFFPTYISGIQLWLDGADPLNTSVAPANGTIISTWFDKSGNARNATSLRSPVFNTSSNAILLNGSDQGFSFTYSGVHPTETAFMVLNMSTPISVQTFMTSPLSYARQFNTNMGQINLRQTNIGTNATTPSTLTASSNTVLGYSLNSSNSFVYFNGTAGPTGTGFGSLPSESNIRIGYESDGAYHLSGSISEILIYDKVLTTSERQVVEGYLAWKWNIQISLTSNHPFRYSAPNSLSISGMTNYSYSPSYLPGLTAWYDAADPLGTGFQPANGTVISTWADKTSESLNPMIATGSPTYTTGSQNGLPGITISGNSGFNMTNYFQAYIPSGTFLSELNAFVVYKNTSPVVYNTVITRSSTAAMYNAPLDMYNTGFVAGIFPDSYTALNSSFDLYNTTTSILNVTLTQSTQASSRITAYRNGTGATLTLTGGSNLWIPSDTGTHLYLGTRGDKYTGFNGIFYEAMVFNYPLTPSGRQYVEGYLAWKWGLQNSLPTTHPYYAAAPSITSLFFQPSQIFGLNLWLDGADPLNTGILPANGATISTWFDKSPNAFPVTSVGSPTYALATRNITMNGIDQGFYFTYSGVHPTETGFFVVNMTTPNSHQVFMTSAPTYARQFYNYYTELVLGQQNIGTNAVPTSTLTASSNTLLGYTLNSSNSFFYFNGTAGPTGTGFNNLPSESTIFVGYAGGGGLFLGGTLSEVILFNTVLTITERQVVEGYLAWKWGIQASLQPQHPYKNFQPSLLTFAPSLTNTSMIPVNFQPTQISGLNLWLDGTDPLNTSVAPANGTIISTWFDKSSNGFNATTAAGTLSYSNGVSSGVVFTGNQFMTTALNSRAASESAFVVLKFNNITEQQHILSWNFGGGAARGREYMLFSSQLVFDSTTGVIYYSSNAPSAGVTFLGEYTYTTSVLNMYLNSSNTLSNTSISFTPGSQGTTIGSYNGGGYLNGTINEIVVYNSVLTTSERQVVEGYLAWKWGIQASLQALHPYKNLKPSLTIAVNFQPTQINGLNLWLDGSDPLNTSVAPANGTTITTWADKSGNARNATSIGSPVYNSSSNAIVLNGSTQAFTFSYPGVHPTETGFFVVNMTTPNSYAFFINSPITSGRQLYDYFNELYLGQTYIGGVGATTSSKVTASSNTVLGYSLNSSESFLYFKGSPGSKGTGFGSFPSESTLYIGYSGEGQFLGGTISEILIYDKVLTNSERQQVERYLMTKWGIQASLPSQSIIANADAFLPLQSNTIDYAKTEQIVGSNGTLPFYNVLGKNCIFINGSTSNYISLPIANPPVFTFAFWFNYTNTQYFTVASYTTPAGAFAMQFDLVSAGSNTIYTALPNQWTNAPSSSNLGVNTWNFIAVTVNQSTYVENVYMNGVFASTATGTGAFPNSPSSNSPSLMVLGKSGDGTVFPSGGNRSYQGYLQNFMYFNTILTGAQINAIYNQTATDLARATQPTSLSLSFANPTLSLSWTAGLNTTSYVVNFYGVSANTNVGGILLTTVTTTSTSATYNPGNYAYYYATVIPTNSGFLGTIATSSAVLRT